MGARPRDRELRPAWLRWRPWALARLLPDRWLRLAGVVPAAAHRGRGGHWPARARCDALTGNGWASRTGLVFRSCSRGDSGLTFQPLTKGGSGMTCVECGSEMGTASVCARCGAPVPGHLLDKVAERGSQQGRVASLPDFPDTWRGCLVVTGLFLIDVVAVLFVITGIVYAIRGPGPGKYGTDYFPLSVSLSWALGGATVLVLTVVGAAARRRSVRRAWERRALASDAPDRLPENSG
jgi:hypothetical protein